MKRFESDRGTEIEIERLGKREYGIGYVGRVRVRVYCKARKRQDAGEKEEGIQYVERYCYIYIIYFYIIFFLYFYKN